MTGLSDQDRAKKPLFAVHITATNAGDDYYEVGKQNITSIGWGWTSGHMAALQTIQVYKNGKLHSEHPFCNVLSVFYEDGQ